jgi:dCMP deaminase
MDKWDYRLLELCDLVASWSSDPSTHVGAVIVDSDHIIRSTGYNGLPRGVSYDDKSRITERPKKYSFAAHAEINAIIFAGYNFSKGGILYLATTPVERSSAPCSECSKYIIQAGIKEIVCRRIKYVMQPNDPVGTWRDNTNTYASEMLKEAGVIVREVGI